MPSPYHSIMMPAQVYPKCPDALKKARFTNTNNSLFTARPQSSKYLLYIVLFCSDKLRNNSFFFFYQIKKQNSRSSFNKSIFLIPHQTFFPSSMHQFIISEPDYMLSCATVNQDWHHWSTGSQCSFSRAQERGPSLGYRQARGVEGKKELGVRKATGGNTPTD